MSTQPWSSGVDARELVLSVWRRPEAHAALVAGRGVLPDDVIDVMRLAKEAASHRGESAYEDELHQAALYFVENVLLGSGSDHYRVLGVTRDANPDVVREHYRLLVAIFHPDRCPGLGTGWEQLAARINVAYRILRDPVARAAYDLDHGRSRTIEMAVDPVGTVPGRTSTEEPLDRFASCLPSTVRRNLQAFVLATAALIGMILVLDAYFNRAPTEAIGMGALGGNGAEGRQASAGVPDRARESLSNRVDRQSRSETRPLPASGARQAPQQSALVDTGGHERDSRTPIAAVQDVGELRASQVERGAAKKVENAAVAGSQPKDSVSKTGWTLHGSDASRSSRSADDRSPASGESERVAGTSIGEADSGRSGASMKGQGHVELGVPERVVELPAASVYAATLGLHRDEAQGVLDQFAIAYRHGDLKALMRLFADDAQSNSGDRKAIRADYEGLFSVTRARDIEFNDLKWTLDENRGVAEGTFIARVLAHEEQTAGLHLGTLRFEVVKVNGRVRISGLFYRSAK